MGASRIRVKVSEHPGPAILESELIPGVLLDTDIPIEDLSLLFPIHAGRAAIITSSIGGTKELAEMGDAQFGATQPAQFTDAITALGVRVVFCQKVVAPRIVHALALRGVACIQRLSIRYASTRCIHLFDLSEQDTHFMRITVTMRSSTNTNMFRVLYTLNSNCSRLLQTRR